MRRGQKRKKLGIKDKEGEVLADAAGEGSDRQEEKKLSKKGDSDSGPFSETDTI